ncbi:hypothetical protein ALT721_1550039 [Alteromonas alvinellae]
MKPARGVSIITPRLRHTFSRSALEARVQYIKRSVVTSLHLQTVLSSAG